MRNVDADNECVRESASDGGARIGLQRLRLAPSIEMIRPWAAAWLHSRPQVWKVSVERADAKFVDERREADREHRRRRRRVVVELCDDDHRAVGLADVRLELEAAFEESNPRQHNCLSIFLN